MPERALPRVEPSAGILGETRPEALHGHAVPLAGIAGDQQAALFGQACLDPGMGKNTYGTGSFVLLNAGFTVPEPPRGLLATVAWGIGESRTYALEASIFVTGAAVQWLRDGLRIIERAEETETLAASLDGNDGVYFVPALTGLGLAALGPLRARDDRRADAGRAAARTWRARRSRRSPTRRSTRSARWRRVRAAAERAAGRRRRQRQRLADAVPGRHAGRSGGAARDRRDDRARRRLSGGRRRRAAGRSATCATAWRERARYEPRMGEDERASLLAGWNDALARARGRRREARRRLPASSCPAARNLARASEVERSDERSGPDARAGLHRPPAEGVLRPLPRARAHARTGLGLRADARDHLAVRLHVPARARHLHREGARLAAR